MDRKYKSQQSCDNNRGNRTDGVELSSFLTQKGYFVVGLTRRFIKPLQQHGNSCPYFNGNITEFETVKSLISFALQNFQKQEVTKLSSCETCTQTSSVYP